MEGSTASLYRLAHWSSVRPGSSFATSYQRFPCLLTASKRAASSLVVQRPWITCQPQVGEKNAVINTFAKLRIKRMNPALSTSFVVPTCAIPVNMREAEMAIEHTRHRFGDMFPTDLSTAYNKGIIVICVPGKIKIMNRGLHAATASVRNLSSSGVHGTNLGGVMVGRRG